MSAMPHRIEDEAVATEAVDAGTLVAENAGLRDRLMRALADAENTRRRAERTAEEARKYALTDFARELLIVVDNLLRMVVAAEERSTTAEGAALVEGARATMRLLMQTLERFEVRPIAALGERFDPNQHEAIMEVEDPSQAPGTVIRVVEQGYTISDRLLRPARVFVSKQPVRATSSPKGEQAESEYEAFSLDHRQ